jgi:hypothetical protein
MLTLKASTQNNVFANIKNNIIQQLYLHISILSIGFFARIKIWGPFTIITDLPHVHVHAFFKSDYIFKEFSLFITKRRVE